jgi:hypothetical protein
MSRDQNARMLQLLMYNTAPEVDTRRCVAIEFYRDRSLNRVACCVPPLSASSLDVKTRIECFDLLSSLCSEGFQKKISFVTGCEGGRTATRHSDIRWCYSASVRGSRNERMQP